MQAPPLSPPTEPAPLAQSLCRRAARYALGLALLTALLCGCTSWREYVHNGFKVGPNYGRPPAPVAKTWIDAGDKRLRTETEDLSQWWTAFNDPELDSLICYASRQNLTLRQAGFRVLHARAQLGIAIGELFPQTQDMNGTFTRNALSVETANSGRNTATGTATLRRFFPQWNYGFSLAWELDFWGRFRRAVEQAAAVLDEQVESYDAAMVTLLGDVATAYVQIRTLERQIELTRANVNLQRATLTIAEALFKGGKTTDLDVEQARSNLAQTESQIPALVIQLRQANNMLCVLLGIPPEDLRARLGSGAIPTAPAEVAVGIPADLLRRRPDVRQAERLVAADSAAIGIAESELYPHIALSGTFGYTAESFNRLFGPTAFEGQFGPQFTWNILNYGRLLNNVRAQTATFQADVAAYQNTVLTATQDVENSLTTFLKSQEQEKYLAVSVAAAEKAVQIALAQYKGGQVNFNTVALVEQNLVTQQNLLAQAQGSIATGLVSVYRALGGGWEIRINGCTPHELPLQGVAAPAGNAPAAAPAAGTPAEPLPPPRKEPPPPAVPAARFGMPLGQ
jgi:NodT family efflux transporter outer membrane factor (OMF) lipoprotein